MFIILPSFRMIKPDQNVLMDVLWAVTRPLITILTSLLSLSSYQNTPQYHQWLFRDFNIL